MKKLFHIFTLFLLLVSCSDTEYRITGKIDNAADGDSVLLGYSTYGDEFTQTDIAYVKDKQFEFTGNVDGCKIYYIVYGNIDNDIYAPFFLEKGDIYVELSDDACRVTGTATNDLNTTFEDTLAQQIKEIYAIQYQLYSDSLMSDSARSALSISGYEKQTNSMAYVKEKIRENITSMFGLYLIVQFPELFDDDELTELNAKIPKENCDRKNNCLYDILQEIISERKEPQSNIDPFGLSEYGEEIEKELMKEN